MSMGLRSVGTAHGWESHLRGAVLLRLRLGRNARGARSDLPASRSRSCPLEQAGMPAHVKLHSRPSISACSLECDARQRLRYARCGHVAQHAHVLRRQPLAHLIPPGQARGEAAKGQSACRSSRAGLQGQYGLMQTDGTQSAQVEVLACSLPPPGFPCLALQHMLGPECAGSHPK